jgi:uncharacterized protein YraI
MKKYLWLITLLIVLTVPLTGCSLTGGEETKIDEPINVAEWPTPLPTVVQTQPTPFPKVTLPPTVTPSPVTAPSPTPTAAAQTETAVGGVNINTILEQVGSLGGLSPVAVAFTTVDTGVYQRPSAASELSESVKSAEMLAILGQNPNGNWLYVITITAARGWIAADALRITGSLAEAPVLPDDPIAAALAQVLGAEIPTTEEEQPAADTAPQQTAPAVIPAAAQTNVDAPPLPRHTLAEITAAIVTRKVDMRRGPGENFGEVNTLTVDEAVMVRAVSPDRKWAVVEAPFSKIGWAPLDSLSVSGSLENAPAVLTAWVNSNELDVRDGPGIYYDAVGKLGINEIVSVLGLNQGRSWALVETRAGGLGWIQLRLLTVSGSLADVAELDNGILAAVWQAETPAVAAVATAPVGRALADSQIVIQRTSGGEIMVINPDGSGLRQLTTGIDPVLSPDGQTVAFTRWQGDSGSVWLIGIDGNNERQILGNVKQVKGPDWSPDGSQLMVNYQQGGRLQEKQDCVDAEKVGRPPSNAYSIKFVIETNSDGEKEAKLCWMVPADPYWSLRLINLADGSFTDHDGGTYAFRPAFDPARPWRVVSDGGRGLLAIDINNPDYRQPLTDNLADSAPVFSPNGQFMAVFGGATGSDQGYNIYRLNGDGGGRIKLTDTPLWVAVQPEAKKQWNNVAPAWSSDGSQIAFLTDRAGRWELWVMNPDGSNQHPLFSNEVNDLLNFEYNFVDERVISWR